MKNIKSEQEESKIKKEKRLELQKASLAVNDSFLRVSSQKNKVMKELSQYLNDCILSEKLLNDFIQKAIQLDPHGDEGLRTIKVYANQNTKTVRCLLAQVDKLRDMKTHSIIVS
jgi:hypothetical protein